MPQTAAILSLHFSPAHASHVVALAKLLQAVGFDVTLVLQEQYLSLVDFFVFGWPICTEKGLSTNSHFEVAIFCNAAPSNHRVAARMRAARTTVVYLFHEPDSVWNHLAEGLPEIVRLIAARYCSIAMLRRSCAVIVPSACAQTLYQRYFQKYNRNVHTLPLVLDDEISAERLAGTVETRPYFAFIGNALKAHDFEGFLAFAKHAMRAGSSFRFLVATKTDLGQLVARDAELSSYAKSGQIEIHHGRVMPIQEINEYHLRSFCVWNVYKCSTQSGVLARAFMSGSPVLANRIGSFTEFVQAGANGEFVESNDPAAILDVVEGMRSRVQTYVRGCRRSFLNTFYYQANQTKLNAILASAAATGSHENCPDQSTV